MSKQKRIFFGVCIPIFVIALSLCYSVFGIAVWRYNNTNQYDFSPLNGAANKTILFVGDGMGRNHISVCESYYETDLFLPTFGEQGEITTFSKQIFFPTDSAAAGSALATGRKYYNLAIAYSFGKKIDSISDYAKSQGYGVGIVTTDTISGATPSSFSANASNRADKATIIKSQIESGVDLFLGAGYGSYIDYKDEFESEGYSFYSNFDELQNSQASKLIAAFDSVAASYNGDAPTLSMLTEYALSFMESNFPSGYFLMIEGAHIDKASHKNNITSMAEYLYDFDKSVEYAHSLFSIIANSAIIVTADHETGGLRYDNQSKSQISDSLYTRTEHSSKNVPYFIYLNTTMNVDLKNYIGRVMDNTDIFKLCRAFLTQTS